MTCRNRKKIKSAAHHYLGPDLRPKERYIRLPEWLRTGYQPKTEEAKEAMSSIKTVEPATSTIFAILDGRTGRGTGKTTYYDLGEMSWVIEDAEGEKTRIEFNPLEVFSTVSTTQRNDIQRLMAVLRLNRDEFAECLGLSRSALDSRIRRNKLTPKEISLVDHMIQRRKKMEERRERE